MCTFKLIKTALATAVINLGAISHSIAAQTIGDAQAVVVVLNTFAQSARGYAVISPALARGYSEITAMAMLHSAQSSLVQRTFAVSVELKDRSQDMPGKQVQFARQRPADVAALGAAHLAYDRCPIAEHALREASAEPNWRQLQSWFFMARQTRTFLKLHLSL